MDEEREYYDKLVYSLDAKDRIIEEIDQIMSETELDTELRDILVNSFTALEERFRDVKEEIDNDFEEEKKIWLGEEDPMDVYHRHLDSWNNGESDLEGNHE